MTYFSKFPLTVYKLDSKESVVTDILRRARFISEYKPYSDLYTPYTITDGESIESVAMTLYGASTYHWVVMLFNEIHNPYFEWPLSTLNMIRKCTDYYGEDTMYKTKHFEKNGLVVGEYKEFSKEVLWVPPINPAINDLTILPVSFYEYEEKENDKKRYIKIMRPELLGEFVRQFTTAINV